MQEPNFDWLVPHWPAPPGIRALCTSRQGGVSQGPYSGLNLGKHVGDSADRVQINRDELQARLGVRSVFLNQVHGTQVADISLSTPDDTEADAAITGMAGVACTVMVADCLPVLFCDVHGTRIAVAHAGWRGLLGTGGQGILEATVAQLCASAAKDDVLAWLGPCIGPGAFEVGQEVFDAFVQAHSGAASYFSPSKPGKWLADLPGLARQRLAGLGIDRVYGNDGSLAWCTVSNPSRFFSHRRDGVSGRMAACIWRRD